MDYFAGLDVSVKETSVCIVDDAGKIVREARVASEPEALLQVLTNTARPCTSALPPNVLQNSPFLQPGWPVNLDGPLLPRSHGGS